MGGNRCSNEAPRILRELRVNLSSNKLIRGSIAAVAATILIFKGLQIALMFPGLTPGSVQELDALTVLDIVISSSMLMTSLVVLIASFGNRSRLLVYASIAIPVLWILSVALWIFRFGWDPSYLPFVLLFQPIFYDFFSFFLSVGFALELPLAVILLILASLQHRRLGLVSPEGFLDENSAVSNSELVYCANCGTRGQGGQFCQGCGSKLELPVRSPKTAPHG